jgi:hypothetical protein
MPKQRKKYLNYAKKVIKLPKPPCKQCKPRVTKKTKLKFKKNTKRARVNRLKPRIAKKTIRARAEKKSNVLNCRLRAHFGEWNATEFELASSAL